MYLLVLATLLGVLIIASCAYAFFLNPLPFCGHSAAHAVAGHEGLQPLSPVMGAMDVRPGYDSA